MLFRPHSRRPYRLRRALMLTLAAWMLHPAVRVSASVASRYCECWSQACSGGSPEVTANCTDDWEGLLGACRILNIARAAPSATSAATSEGNSVAAGMGGLAAMRTRHRSLAGPIPESRGSS